MTRITTIVLIYLISSLTSQERGFNLKNIQKYSYVNNSYVFNLHYKINDINYSQFTFLPSIDTTFLRAGDYKIMILSKYLNDSLSSDSPIWFYPIFLDQKIIL